MLIINTQSHLNYITNKLYLMSCRQWLARFQRKTWQLLLYGYCLEYPVNRKLIIWFSMMHNEIWKSCFSLTLHWLSAWLQNYCEEHFNRCIHQVDWFSFFSFVVVEEIYRRRQPFLSMDAIYFIQPPKEK